MLLFTAGTGLKSSAKTTLRARSPQRRRAQRAGSAAQDMKSGKARARKEGSLASGRGPGELSHRDYSSR